MGKTASLFSEEASANIVAAIAVAEEKTSAEVRVHIENTSGGDAMKAAKTWFHNLKMDETENRNGVLIYIALKDREFAIFGDEGIYSKEPQSFWDGLAGNMQEDFSRGEFEKGLIAVIDKLGDELGRFFPSSTQSNPNELSDEISHSDN
jgi:uncharacterized membrane protein